MNCFVLQSVIIILLLSIVLSDCRFDNESIPECIEYETRQIYKEHTYVTFQEYAENYNFNSSV